MRISDGRSDVCSADLSSHQPFSDEGAVLFRSLWQMSQSESRHVRIDTGDPSSWRRHAGRDICPLFSDESEQVSLQRLVSAEVLFTDWVDGAELLVLDGQLMAAEQFYERGSRIRLPAGEYPEFIAGPKSATLYLKSSAEHTSELQSLMRISYAVYCLYK